MLPRRSVIRAILVVLALGAALGIAIAGFVTHTVWMQCVFPAAFGVLRVVDIFLPSDDSLLAELARSHPEVLGDAELLSPGCGAACLVSRFRRKSGTALALSVLAVIVATTASGIALLFAGVAAFMALEALVGGRRTRDSRAVRRAVVAIAVAAVASSIWLYRTI